MYFRLILYNEKSNVQLIRRVKCCESPDCFPGLYNCPTQVIDDLKILADIALLNSKL